MHPDQEQSRRLYTEFVQSDEIRRHQLLPHVRELAGREDANMLNLLAWYYLNVSPKKRRAVLRSIGYCRRAIACGGVGLSSHYYLGSCLWWLDKTDPDIRRHLRKASDLNAEVSPDAQCDLGVAYMNGAGGAASRRWAEYWLSKAGQSGDELAKRNLLKLVGNR
jgi:TPR repeat protein